MKTKTEQKHAELVALERLHDEIGYEATKGLDWNRMELYVTVEPCVMRRYVRCKESAKYSMVVVMKDLVDVDRAKRPRWSFVPDEPLNCQVLKEFRTECIMLLRKFYM